MSDKLIPNPIALSDNIDVTMPMHSWMQLHEYLLGFYYGPHSGNYAPGGVNQFLDIMKMKMYTPQSIKAFDASNHEAAEQMNPFRIFSGQVPLTPEQFEDNPDA
jgi:hypothetical protein